MNTESGRSMVEMLGVLAIIGVLSIGGIAGYTLAMRRYRANEALNALSMSAIYAMTRNGGLGSAGAVNASDIGMSAWPAGLSGGVSCFNAERGTLAFTASDPNVATLMDDIGGSKVTCSGTSCTFDPNS